MNSESERIIFEYTKSSWPKLHITKENLARPTPELVKEFYTNFLIDYCDRIQSLAGPYYSPIDLINVEYAEPEESLFLRMCPIMERLNQPFKLSDIYEPISVRTKNFFMICCHLLMFTDSISDDVEKMASSIMKTKEDINILKKEHEELLMKMNEKAIIKSELMEKLEKICAERESINISYEQMKDLKTQKEKKYGDLRKKIEMLKRELQKEQFELSTMEAKEKGLTAQTVNEMEYNNLKTIVSNLETELNTLGDDNVDMEDVLLHENDVLLHYKDCQKRVPTESDFATDLLNSLTEREEILKTRQIDNDKLTNKYSSLNSAKNHQEQIQIELKKSYENLSQQLQTLKTYYLNTKEEYRKELSKLKGKIESQRKLNTDTIQTCLNNISKLEEQLTKLKETFAKEYIKISERYEAVKDYYRNVVPKCTEQL